MAGVRQATPRPSTRSAGDQLARIVSTTPCLSAHALQQEALYHQEDPRAQRLLKAHAHVYLGVAHRKPSRLTMYSLPGPTCTGTMCPGTLVANQMDRAPSWPGTRA